MEPNGSDLGRELHRQQLERLAARANIHLHRQEYDQAAAACEEILALDETRGTIHRALGDIRLHQHRPEEARACYQRALELMPGDAHAERQLAVLALHASPGQHDEQRMLELLEDPSKRQRSKKSVGCASFAALTFPGFGQIYNGDFLKGGVLFGSGVLLLGVILHLAFINPFVQVARQAGGIAGKRETVSVAQQIERALDVIGHYPASLILLLLLALLLFTALIAYGAWDAVKVCRELTAQDDRLVES